jgi:colanic acid/amylovoran biosynthesis glycosyltransferase
MKIAYITNAYPIVYHTFVINEIIELMNAGIEVWVFAFHRDKVVKKELDRNLLRLADNVRYFVDMVSGIKNSLMRRLMAQSGRIKRLSPTGFHQLGKWLFDKDSRNADTEPYHDDLDWLRYAVFPLAELIKLEKFDAIHAGFGNRPATAAMLLSRYSGVPFTFTTHAYDLFVNFPYASEKLARAAAVFTISNYNKRYLTDEHNCPPEKVHLLRVPFNKDRCDRISRNERDAKLIVSVGRLHPIKGLDYALEAIRIVSQKHKDICLVLVGDGPLENHLKTKAKQLGIEANVKFLGTMNNEAALELVSSSALFLLPSVIGPDGDRDGIPTAMIEAMYLETPVVSTRISGIPELVDDGVNGFLAEPGDVETLADRIDRLMGDEALRLEMGRRAREKVEHGFYEDSSGSILVRHWRQIVGKK